MHSAKPEHRLSNVDLEHRTAVCSVCGPTEIYVSVETRYRAPKRICINKMREKAQDYQRRQREKKGLPEPVRRPRHRLSEIDAEKMRAVCSVCGPTDIGNAANRISHYYCKTARRKSGEAYRRAHGIVPRMSHTSHHHLSQVDYGTRTAICSKCGPVRISIINLGKRFTRQCVNAQAEYKEQVIQKSQNLISEYKVRRGCRRCGYKADPAGLELHRHGFRRRDNRLPQAVLLNKKRLLKELEECTVYCVNCHALVHGELA